MLTVKAGICSVIELPASHPARDAIVLLGRIRAELPADHAGDKGAVLLGSAILYLWDSEQY